MQRHGSATALSGFASFISVLLLWSVLNLGISKAVVVPEFSPRHPHEPFFAEEPMDTGVMNDNHDLESFRARHTGCDLPSDPDLVAITPNSVNGGWALPPDRSCNVGMYCPYACRPGLVSAQWNPAASVTIQGGLFCEEQGPIKPFPTRPYCVPSTLGFGAKDLTGRGIAFCQTVYPGYEDMIIPTKVSGRNHITPITIPGPDFFRGSSAHYFINAPGISTDDGCVWGDGSRPLGNWAPYVAGGHTTADGISWLMIGWNPIYIANFGHLAPKFGLSLEICEDGHCVNGPCAVSPAHHGVNEMLGSQITKGAGNATFCTINVPRGKGANFLVSVA